LAAFVAHLSDSRVIRGRIVLDRNERRHAAHRMNVSTMARANEQPAVGAQEMRRHGDLRAFGENHVPVTGEFLDEAEDVVPAAAIQSSGMLAQFVENLVHFERSKNRFDQHGGTDVAADARLQRFAGLRNCAEMWSSRSPHS
jgi:hypothetical protein